MLYIGLKSDYIENVEQKRYTKYEIPNTMKIVLSTFIVITSFLLSPISVFAVLPPQSSSTQVSASVGEYQFTLYGQSSPEALVTVQGMGIYDQTTADNQGNFVFNNRFSPFSPREACITAQDQFGRTSSPTCLPPFPTRYNVTVGPVLLPATLSLDKNDYFVDDTIILSGQTIPNSEVNLSMFTKDKNLIASIFDLNIVKSAYAANFPEYKTKTDDKGNFSISLPSSKALDYRLFTRTEVGKNTSPKSVMLNLSVLPWWMIIIKYFLFIWQIIRPRLLEIIILVEITAAAYYIYTHYLHPHKIKALMVREKKAIMIKP